MKIIKKLIIIISFITLFSGTFYAFASRYLFDYDFWWHISTGRYIVETKTIPETDPFNYPSELAENKNLFPEREKLILKQYWLAQIFMYLIYSSFGPQGIILLRAILLTGLLLLVFYRLRKWDVSFYICFTLLVFLFMTAIRHIGERPVLFTILFTPLTFILLESFKEKHKKSLFFLPLLMLLWSNIHGGFIIGIIVIIVFMIGEGLKIILKKSPLERREILLFYVLTTLAVGFSYINPTGWDAFSIALSPEYKFMEEGIQEYASLFYLYKEKLAPVNYGTVSLLILSPIVLIFRNIRMDITHILLVSGFFVMALQSGRYDIYYAAIAAMVLGKETNTLLQNLFKKRFSEKTYSRLQAAFNIATLLSAIIFFTGFSNFTGLKFDIATGYSVPKAAVDFIEKNKIDGKIFNDGAFGGYITWRLYPGKKTFADTRWLNYTTKLELYWVLNCMESVKGHKLEKGKSPLWERILDHYDANIIITEIFDVYGQVVNMVLTLADSERWVPVFSDSISVVFIKNSDQNRDIIAKFRQTKENIFNMVIYKACIYAKSDKENPKYLLSIARAFHKMGSLQEARTAYQYALARSPNKEPLQKKIEEIEAELTGQKKNERD